MSTRLIVVLALILVGLLPSLAPVSATAGSRIVSAASGRCLDVVGGSTASRARIDIAGCSGQARQAWTLTAAGELRVYAGALCLDVAGQDTTAPAIVETYPCNGGANQHWTLNANGSITGVQSHLCLDVTGAGWRTGHSSGCGRVTARPIRSGRLPPAPSTRPRRRCRRIRPPAT